MSNSRYTHPIPTHGGAMLLLKAEFLNKVEHRIFIDYDGFGYPAKMVNGALMSAYGPSNQIIPSKTEEIPLDATHIVWYNR